MDSRFQVLGIAFRDGNFRPEPVPPFFPGVVAQAGGSNTEVADDLGLTKQTVGKSRERFRRRRLDGLLDEPRPEAPRKITDAELERVLRLTPESTPRDATRWSTRAMAKRSGLSRTAVSRIWRAFALQPHRVETFKLSKGPLFIEKVRDIVVEPCRM